MGEHEQFFGERMRESPSELIRGWLRRQLPEPAEQWLDAQLAKLAEEPSERNLQIALGMAPRRLGKDDLALSPGDLAAAATARPGWDPRGWSVDGAARILILVAAGGRGQAFATRFTALCQTADAGEAIALYRGLPLYPDPELLEAQAAEGVRSNMRGTFEAVAHRNPFPRERFDETRDEASRKAAALALAASPAPEAKVSLAALGDLASAIESGGLSWESLAREMQQAP